jgi:hypothetical protein
MTDAECRLLQALCRMVDQYLPAHGKTLDSMAMRAGQDALKVLAEHGLVEYDGTRFGDWTESGIQFLKSIPIGRWTQRGSSVEQPTSPGAYLITGRSKPK